MILSPLPVQKFFDNNGRPLVGGQLFTYEAGTTNKIATYTDESGGSLNTNPVILDFRGECRVWLDPELTYKFVLAPRGDTDPPSAPIWTEDNIAGGLTVSVLTQQFLGKIIYPRTPQEIAQNVFPILYIYPPGNVWRYGADPTGVDGADGPFSDAIECNSLVTVPDGNYLFETGIQTARSGVTIESPNKHAAIITLAAAAGSGVAAFRWTAFAQSVTVRALRIEFEQVGLDQIGLRFAELRNSLIEGNRITGSASSSDDTIAILFDGTGTYTGDVDVVNNFLANHIIGIDLLASCTTVRIESNEIYGTAASVANSKGVRCAAANVGVLIQGNTFEGWVHGVYTEGTRIRQGLNYFEANTTNWEWVRGSGNARIWNESVGDQLISGGTPVYPRNFFDSCMAALIDEIYIDNGFIESGLGFKERGRAAAIGVPTTPAFSAGDFTASGSMTWTVEAGDVITYAYIIVGTTMTVFWRIATSVAGGIASTELRIAIPAGFSAVKRIGNTCRSQNAGTRAVGWAEVLASDTFISIYTDVTAASNWTLGTVETDGQLSFEIQ